VHGLAVHAGIVREKLRKLLLPSLGADIEERVMADAAWEDGESALPCVRRFRAILRALLQSSADQLDTLPLTIKHVSI
jgi:hypothetical protein